MITSELYLRALLMQPGSSILSLALISVSFSVRNLPTYIWPNQDNEWKIWHMLQI
jgi:hypothetical protein